MALDERDVDPWVSDEDAVLVQRLRNLEWPKASPEVRERVLRAVWSRVAAANGRVMTTRGLPALDRDAFRRHEFSRRRTPAALTERVLAARGLSAPRGGHRSVGARRACALR